jgi:hypothetical protein
MYTVWKSECDAQLLLGKQQSQFYETAHSERYVRLILFWPVDKKKTYGHFMQDNATAHTANSSMNAEVLWTSCDLNPFDFYLWDPLTD